MQVLTLVFTHLQLTLQAQVGIVSKLIKGLTDNQHLKLMHVSMIVESHCHCQYMDTVKF